jgi:MFS family permease
MSLRVVRTYSSTTVIAVLAISGMAASLMQTLLVPLLGDLPGILHASADDVSWVITATLLSSAVATPTLTRLADMFGKKRMMLVCLGLLLVGSTIGALTSTLTLVIIARIFQGTASALIPIGMSIMRDELPEEKLSGAVALMSATLGIGAAIGMPLSGIVYSAFGWHAIFWVSGIFAVAMFLAITVVVRESDIRTGGRFDYLGAFLLSGALTALLLGISKGGSWGWTSSQTLFTFGICAALMALWIPLEFRTERPLVDLRVSLLRPVLITNIASMLMGFAMYANMLATFQLLEMPTSTGYGHGLTSLQAGLIMIPTCLTMVILAPVSAKITRRHSAKITLISGAALMGFGYFERLFFNNTVLLIAIAAIIVSAGTAISFAAMPLLIMGAVPETETSAANGLNSLLRSIGSSVSSAAIAGILAVIVVEVGGKNLPTQQAFQMVFILAAMASIVGALIAMAIPKPEHNELAPIDPAIISELVQLHKEAK